MKNIDVLVRCKMTFINLCKRLRNYYKRGKLSSLVFCFSLFFILQNRVWRTFVINVLRKKEIAHILRKHFWLFLNAKTGEKMFKITTSSDNGCRVLSVCWPSFRSLAILRILLLYWRYKTTNALLIVTSWKRKKRLFFFFSSYPSHQSKGSRLIALPLNAVNP